MAEIDIPIPLSQFRHINVGKHSLEKVIRKRSTGRSIHPEIRRPYLPLASFLYACVTLRRSVSNKLFRCIQTVAFVKRSIIVWKSDTLFTLRVAESSTEVRPGHHGCRTQRLEPVTTGSLPIFSNSELLAYTRC